MPRNLAARHPLLSKPTLHESLCSSGDRIPCAIARSIYPDACNIHLGCDCVKEVNPNLTRRGAKVCDINCCSKITPVAHAAPWQARDVVGAKVSAKGTPTIVRISNWIYQTFDNVSITAA